LDVNADIYLKELGQALTDSNGLNMSEVVGDFTGRPVGPTFFRGTKPIDGVWATKDLQVVNACVMPAGFGVGGHRMFINEVYSWRELSQGGACCGKAAEHNYSTCG
jgi:hypothetical protein